MLFLNLEKVEDRFAMDFLSDMPQNNKLTIFSGCIYNTYTFDDVIFPRI